MKPLFVILRKCLLAAIILLVPFSTVSGLVLAVPQVYQNQTEWCWAGVTKAMLDYYGFSFTQEQIAQYGSEGVNTWNWIWGATTGPTRNGLDLIMNHFGNLYTVPYPRAVTLPESSDEIYGYKPFFVRWGWSSGGGHFVVAKGVQDNTIYLMDPWYGPTINSYDWVVSGSSHTWTHSLGMLIPSTIITASAPNPAHQSSNLALTSVINWTNPPNTSSVEVRFGTTNPPENTVYSGAPVQSLTNLQLGGPLTALTACYWQVTVTTPTGIVPGPVWYFSTIPNGNGNQVGSGTVQNTGTTYPAPYGNYYAGARHQFLVKATELQAAGMTTAGMIKSLAFYTTGAQTTPLTWFSIKLGTTSVNSLTTWITGLQTVYGSTTYIGGSGWNLHPFDEPFYWDGSSNLVVETIFNNNNISSNAVFRQTSTPGFNSTLYFCINDIIEGNNGITGTFQQRPNLLFKYATQLDPVRNVALVRNADNVSLSWTAVPGANSYRIYRTDNPFTADWGVPCSVVTNPVYTDTFVSRRFYRVVAVRN